jgi:hypothetical protein
MATWPERIGVMLFAAAGVLGAAAAQMAKAPATPETQPVPAMPASTGFVLPPWHARYEVLRNGDPLGEATMRLMPGSGDTWVLETATRGTRGLAGLAGAEIAERSVFRWRDGLPELVSYDYRQQVAWKRRERSLRWSDDRKQVLSRSDERSWALPVDGVVMDRQTVALAMAAGLARGVDAASFAVADRDELEPMRFEAGAVETIRVPAGSWPARRVERIRSKPGRTTTSWVVEAYAWMPVRIVQTESDGETIEMRLVERLPDDAKAVAAP